MSERVGTVQGELRGSTASGVHVFLGIPYAAPPVGANRLRPPQPVEPWRGVRDATRPGPEPPQVAPPSTGRPDQGAAEDWTEVTSAFAAVERAAPSGDCLNLNVWTPDPGASGLPVMVCIQGGMFELSSTAAYDGRRFARDGVVCVVINWRPGAAHQVTPAADALRIAGYLAGKLGVPLTRAAIAGAGVERLLAAQAELKAELMADPDPDRWGEAVMASGMPWQPVLDGEVLPDVPVERIAAGSGGSVDLIFGTNADDWRLWLVASAAVGGITDEILS